MTHENRVFAVLVATFACSFLLSSCATEPDRLPRKIVDLSPTITEDLPLRFWGEKLLGIYGWRTSTNFEHLISPVGFSDSYLTLFNHGGPHHDPPSHIDSSAMSTDEFPLEKFFGRARLLDVRQEPKNEPVSLSVLQNAGIQAGDFVLMLVGYEPPIDPEELPSYAYLSTEGAEYLANLPVKGFATDALSVDSFRRSLDAAASGVTDLAGLAPVHVALLSREITVIEQLVNLDELVGEDDIFFVGFPLKIHEGNGSPIRAAALVF